MSNENGELLKETRKRITYTFWSILIFNWILVTMGVVAFYIASLKALGGEFDIAALFGALGTADVISLFKFSMDRVQRSLGDQVQVETACAGHLKQMDFVKDLVKGLGSNPKITIDYIERINEEIRRATLYSMELIQDFTKIAEPLKEKPWIRALPVRYGKLKINGKEIEEEFTVKKGKKIILSGTLRNVSNKSIKINTIVIAVRPPGGTPDGGPFRFDFAIREKAVTLKPKQSVTIKNTKTIEQNMKDKKKTEEIKDEWYGKDWYAFMTCQTEDGCWHDDHNKYWFELKKT